MLLLHFITARIQQVAQLHTYLRSLLFSYMLLFIFNSLAPFHWPLW